MASCRLQREREGRATRSARPAIQSVGERAPRNRLKPTVPARLDVGSVVFGRLCTRVAVLQGMPGRHRHGVPRRAPRQGQRAGLPAAAHERPRLPHQLQGRPQEPHGTLCRQVLPQPAPQGGVHSRWVPHRQRRGPLSVHARLPQYQVVLTLISLQPDDAFLTLNARLACGVHVKCTTEADLSDLFVHPQASRAPSQLCTPFSPFTLSCPNVGPGPARRGFGALPERQGRAAQGHRRDRAGLPGRELVGAQAALPR